MGDLQFERAEFDGKTQACAACKRNIGGAYYSLNGHVICAECRDALGAVRQPVTVLTLAMSLAFGGVAAVVGAAVWGLITYSTGSQLGIVAVIVGLGIGYAVSRGSRRAGGWLFQGVAMALTYLAIAGSWIPVILRDSPSADWLSVTLASLTLPVRASTSSVLSLLINAFAVYEAWKVNKRPVIQITGPFQAHTAPAAPEATTSV